MRRLGVQGTHTDPRGEVAREDVVGECYCMNEKKDIQLDGKS